MSERLSLDMPILYHRHFRLIWASASIRLVWPKSKLNDVPWWLLLAHLFGPPNCLATHQSKTADSSSRILKEPEDSSKSHQLCSMDLTSEWSLWFRLSPWLHLIYWRKRANILLDVIHSLRCPMSSLTLTVASLQKRPAMTGSNLKSDGLSWGLSYSTIVRLMPQRAERWCICFWAFTARLMEGHSIKYATVLWSKWRLKAIRVAQKRGWRSSPIFAFIKLKTYELQGLLTRVTDWRIEADESRWSER